jgi:hypothetical protein
MCKECPGLPPQGIKSQCRECGSSAPISARREGAGNAADRRYASITTAEVGARSAPGQTSAPTRASRASVGSAVDRRYAGITSQGIGARSARGRTSPPTSAARVFVAAARSVQTHRVRQTIHVVRAKPTLRAEGGQQPPEAEAGSATQWKIGSHPQARKRDRECQEKCCSRKLSFAATGGRGWFSSFFGSQPPEP